MRKFEEFYQHFVEYVDKTKKTYINCRYVCKDGYKLGYVARCIRGKYTKLTEEQKARLDEAHFEWKGRKKGIFPETFERYFQAIQQYYKEHGNCLVPQLYRDAENNHVGVMVSYIRKMQDSLNQQQKDRLNEIHFVWKQRNAHICFEEFCERHIAYEQKFKTRLIPVRYATPDGVKLGEIARNYRYGKRKLSDREKKKLDAIGFVWNARKYRAENFTPYEKKAKNEKK